jgi:hypothetical protein
MNFENKELEISEGRKPTRHFLVKSIHVQSETCKGVLVPSVRLSCSELIRGSEAIFCRYHSQAHTPQYSSSLFKVLSTSLQALASLLTATRLAIPVHDTVINHPPQLPSTLRGAISELNLPLLHPLRDLLLCDYILIEVTFSASPSAFTVPTHPLKETLQIVASTMSAQSVRTRCTDCSPSRAQSLYHESFRHSSFVRFRSEELHVRFQAYGDTTASRTVEIQPKRE